MLGHRQVLDWLRRRRRRSADELVERFRLIEHHLRNAEAGLDVLAGHRQDDGRNQG